MWFIMQVFTLGVKYRSPDGSTDIRANTHKLAAPAISCWNDHLLNLSAKDGQRLHTWPNQRLPESVAAVDLRHRRCQGQGHRRPSPAGRTAPSVLGEWRARCSRPIGGRVTSRRSAVCTAPCDRCVGVCKVTDINIIIQICDVLGSCHKFEK